jgi:diguanylate cyclase (GGDEF)-like protein/PAS domain S-box-containing protein
LPVISEFESTASQISKQTVEKLARQSELLQGIVNFSDLFIFAKDMQGRFILVSQSMANFYGYKSREELIGKTDYDLHSKITADQLVATDLRTTERKTAIQFEEKIKKNNLDYIFLTVKFPLVNSAGQVYAVCGLAVDITDRIRLEEEVKQNKSLLDFTQRISKVGGWGYDIANDKMTWTAETYRIHGLDPDQVANDASSLIEHSINCYRPEDRPVIMDLFRNCIENGTSYDIELPFTSFNGEQKWIRTIGEAEIADGKILRILGNIADITELRNARETLRYLSFHCPLTGLYNRRYLEEELKRLDTGRQLPLAIIVSDLNNLKKINDLYGHVTGDKIIKAVAEVIKQCCREEDIVARWGGDEYVILLPQTDSMAAETICRRILKNCSQTSVAGQPISIALGLAVKTADDQKAGELFASAEKAMYKHKLSCRNESLQPR